MLRYEQLEKLRKAMGRFDQSFWIRWLAARPPQDEQRLVRRCRYVLEGEKQLLTI